MNKIRIQSLILLISIILLSIAPNANAEYGMPYYIIVDCSNNIVTVYSALDNSVVRQMICSTGTADEPTIQGIFTMPKKGKETDRSEWSKMIVGYARYATRIKGNFLFHSFPYYKKDPNAVKWDEYAAMGTSASLGCIRLYLEDAKWISDNCLAGTKVKIYTGEAPMEFIKVRLYEKTFTIDDGISYEEFMSMATNEDELGYTSEGEDVQSLQHRMVELGLYPGKADGYYGAEMVYAIEDLQAILGLPATGIVDKDLLAFIYSEDCPSSNISCLSEGISGPAVGTLQRTLASLGLYNHEISGAFDSETSEAVKLFQRALGYEADGIATPALQQDMIESLIYLDNKFGSNGFEVTFVEKTSYTGVINSTQRLNVRSEMSTDSRIICRLDPGTEVDILENSNGWAKIMVDNEIGYVKNSYLDISTSVNNMPEYVASHNGTQYPDLVYGENEIISRRYTYGIVSTDNRVNFREGPDSESALEFVLSPGNVCEIVSVNNGIAYVFYGGKFGYSSMKYFDKIETAKITGKYAVAGSSMLDPVAVDDTKRALVISSSGADLYSSASENSDILSTVEKSEILDIIFESTSWTQVRTADGIIGYIKNEEILIGTSSELAAYK